jgi:hypothetical protein
VKIHELRSAREAFDIRGKARAARMRGLVDLFQNGEIPVRKFRHLTARLKAEHNQDQRSTGFTTEKIPSLV